MSARPPHLLHVFSTFDPGGPQVRATQMINAWGEAYRHSIVSVNAGRLGARELLRPGLGVAFPDHPDLRSGALPARLLVIRRQVARLRPDLVLTYNWGAMEVVMARRLLGGPPLVHHEDGFGPEEAAGQLWRRVAFRRLALPTARTVVVPSRTLQRIALETWRQPSSRVVRIPNGVDCEAFTAAPDPAAIPGLQHSGDEQLVGTVAALRPEKNLPRLVRAFAAASRDMAARLVIVGEGPERERILAQAAESGVADRLLLPGFLPAPQRYVGLFDVFALSSDTEQFPISLAEAMAAGRAAVCTDVGDVRAMLSEDNRLHVVAPDDEEALAVALRGLLCDALLRRRLGDANRHRAAQELSLAAMTQRYEQVYTAARDGRRQ